MRQFERRHDCFRIDRPNDQSVYLLRNEILNLIRLASSVDISVKRNGIDAQLFCIGYKCVVVGGRIAVYPHANVGKADFQLLQRLA